MHSRSAWRSVHESPCRTSTQPVRALLPARQRGKTQRRRAPSGIETARRISARPEPAAKPWDAKRSGRADAKLPAPGPVLSTSPRAKKQLAMSRHVALFFIVEMFGPAHHRPGAAGVLVVTLLLSYVGGITIGLFHQETAADHCAICHVGHTKALQAAAPEGLTVPC